jgi:hypothetical protein
MQRKKQKENWFIHISLIAAMIHHDCAAASFSLFSAFSTFSQFSLQPLPPRITTGILC